MPRLGKVAANGLVQDSRYDNVLSTRARTPGRSTYPSERMGGGSMEEVTFHRRRREDVMCLQEVNRVTCRQEEMGIILTTTTSTTCTGRSKYSTLLTATSTVMY
mmetsp:Transcript_31812/g.93426  ORF Transcript_31812/g.93426 Transcript_31812/m.93426 type:complete len:104 (-) Transcript_31812:28-339(-)